MVGATVSRVQVSNHPDYAVGATVGQIGKLKGCHVVGVAGGPEKCRHAVEVLGCGLIAQYNATSLLDGPDRLALLMRTVLSRRIKIQGFIIFDDYASRYDEFYQGMSIWFSEGRVKYREDLVNDLENAPQAFIGLLEGNNFGKLVIRVGNDD